MEPFRYGQEIIDWQDDAVLTCNRCLERIDY